MSDYQPDDSTVSLFARLELHLNRLHDAINANRRRPVPIPVDLRLTRSDTMPASGTGYIDLGSPSQGNVWLVRRIVIGGLSFAITALGRGDVFISAIKPTIASLSDWHDSTGAGNTLPAIAFYDGRNMVVKPNERIWVIISNGTPTQQYIAAASVEQYTEAAFKEMFSL